MTEPPKDTPNTADFEFSALDQARNYRLALFSEFRNALRGDVIEVGAGIGQMTEHLVRMPAIRRAVSIEPEVRFCAELRRRFPGHELIQGTVAELQPDAAFDTVLSINVLEHIQDDGAELDRYAGLLRARHGSLCLFVPARPEIYAPIDKDFGHFRRYGYEELKSKLLRAGFIIDCLRYFNFVGYFAWWFNFCLLKKRAFGRRTVRLFDRLVFPGAYLVESKLVRPPIGQSLIAIAHR